MRGAVAQSKNTTNLRGVMIQQRSAVPFVLLVLLVAAEPALAFQTGSWKGAGCTVPLWPPFPLVGSSWRRPPRQRCSSVSCAAASRKTAQQNRRTTKSTTTNLNGQDSINVRLNEFFKAPVPGPIQKALSVRAPSSTNDKKIDDDVVSLVTAPPGDPGVPRPLWLVILASVPTGLLWYGYYKFAVEEELLHQDLASGRQPRGFGGYGTLGPFVYLCLLGPAAFLLHFPGGLQWTNLGIAFIYYTQFLLYDRVNELYQAEGKEPPLNLWWTLPILFPLDLVVGLRQVHYLAQYWYRKRGGRDPLPVDPVADFFPFISAPRFTWQEFFLTPALWCKLLANVEPIQEKSLPPPVQELLQLGKDRDGNNRRRSGDKA